MNQDIRNIRKSVKRFSGAVLDYRARIAAANGSISEDSVDAHDRFITDLKHKNLWDNLLEIGTFAGTNLAAALIKLKRVASDFTNHGFVEADFIELGPQGGLKNDGVKYLDSNLSASGLTNARGSLFFAGAGAPVNTAAAWMGAAGAGIVNTAWLAQEYVSQSAAAQVDFIWSQDGSDGNVNALAPFEHLLVAGIADADSKQRIFIDGVQIAVAQKLSNTVANDCGNIFVFCVNISGAPSLPWTGRASFYAVGKPTWTAAQVRALNDSVKTLHANLLRNSNVLSLGETPAVGAERTIGDGPQNLGS